MISFYPFGTKETGIPYGWTVLKDQKAIGDILKDSNGKIVLNSGRGLTIEELQIIIDYMKNFPDKEVALLKESIS